MSISGSSEPALPANWVNEFFDLADLDASFASLAGHEHFHAETMRGRIRWFQLRLSEAAEHFDRAMELSRAAPQSGPNSVRKFVLEVYDFENRLVQGMVPDPSPLPEALHDEPEDPESPVSQAFPAIENVELSLHGLVHLYRGEFESAAETYRKLAARYEDTAGAKQATAFLGLAASLFNLGRVDDARHHLENAGFAIQMGGRTLERAKTSANLQAAFTCLGHEELAADWGKFLDLLPCPPSTKRAMRKWGERAVRRWAAESRLLFV